MTDGNGVATPSVTSGIIGDTDGMSIDGMAVGVPLTVDSVPISSGVSLTAGSVPISGVPLAAGSVTISGVPLAAGSVPISGIDSGVGTTIIDTIGDIDGTAIDGMADGIPLAVGSAVSMSGVGSTSIVGPIDDGVNSCVTSTSISTNSVVISTDGDASIVAASMVGDITSNDCSADTDTIGLSVATDGVDMIKVGIASAADRGNSPLDGMAS